MGFNANTRLRAVSTADVLRPQDQDIASLVQRLDSFDRTSYHALQNSLDQSALLQQLRHILKDDNDVHGASSSFRRAGGFQALLRLLRSLVDLFSTHEDQLADVKSSLQTLAQWFAVLGAALEAHDGNQKYFRTKVDDGGWYSLQSTLEQFQSVLCHLTGDGLFNEQFFGILFATAAGTEMIDDIYTSLERSGRLQDTNLLSEVVVSSVRVAVAKAVSDVDNLAVPDLLTTVLRLWAIDVKGGRVPQRLVKLALPLSFTEMLSISRQNIVRAHTAGAFTAVLDLVFEDRLSTVERNLFREAALILCQEGISSLGDAHLLFNQATVTPEAASFLLEAIKSSRQPPSIQFDLSQQGYASTELATLGRPFPPTDTAGYTLSLWARFDSFDGQVHTTLFGAFDRTQTCFVLAYLEKDTHHLILQTAIQGTRPSVRFKSVGFQPDKWYHIAVVHKRPRTTSSSRAFLFVNGDFVEQQKANYPAVAPIDRGSNTPIVQSFFGTPQDLSPNPTGATCLSRWSLGPAVLFQEALSDDLIAVFYHLGPKYHGNFQDCLGSFQTYQASAALNLRNEMLHPGKEEQSELILAIRRKASNLIREDKILINVSPGTVLDNDDRNNIDETQLVKSLSKLAAKNLVAYTRSGTNAVAINGAVPSINDALTQARGVFLLMGTPTVTVPQSLDDASWRLGGCGAVGLGLVRRARTTDDIALAVDILLETVRYSWRNSEVMERDGGYAILAMLLKDKLAIPTQSNGEGKAGVAIPTPRLDRNGLSLRVLTSILSFTGYDFDDPTNSVINNPLAYKVLIADSSVWRCGPLPVQQLYFDQFLVLAEQSQHKRFNIKRLSRMRVLKRLMEALKSEPVAKAIMPLYMAAFKILLPQSLSAETLRSLALFVTFSINKRNTGLQVRKPTRREGRQRSSSTGSSQGGKDESMSTLSHFEIGVEVLRLYSELLCRHGDDSMIKKFAKTVTNKWLLYLLSETSPEVVVLSVRIMARLLVVHGEAYVKKFKDGSKTSGFTIMAYRMKRWWHIPALWPACFSILFGFDVGNLDLDRNFDLFGFVDLFATKKPLSVVYPEIFEVITSMLQSGLKTIVSSKRYSSASTLAPPLEDLNQRPERLSMSTMAPPNPLLTIVTSQHVETFSTVIQFLADLHTRSQNYRDYAATSSYIQDLLAVLFPVVVGSDVVEAKTELDARDAMLTFDGADVVVHPLSEAPPIIRMADAEPPSAVTRGKTLRRGSSFVLVMREHSHQNSGSARASERAAASGSAAGNTIELNEGHSIVQSLLEIVISVFSDQILARKEFPGLGLFLKTPPGFIEHQSYFETWILRNTVSQLSNQIALDQKLLVEPRVLTNLARLFSHLEEALFEGWFIGGADAVLDLSGSVLEYLQRPDIAKLKSVRLCAQTIAVIRAIVFRIVLYSLSSVQDEESLPFLDKLTYWQTVLLSAEETQSNYLQLVCYLLYASLVSSTEAVRHAAANLWRIILVQRPDEAAAIHGHANTAEQKSLTAGFQKVVELDNETFLYWMNEHRTELDSLFVDTLSKQWDVFVAAENKRTEENGRMRISRRRDKLRQWAREEADHEDLLRRHEIASENWTANIYSSEYLKHQRLLQDQQDDLVYTESSFNRMQRDTSRPGGLFRVSKPRKWRLDQTEGRNRMRMRLHEDYTKAEDDQQPKRKGSDIPQLRLDTRNTKISSADSIGVTPGTTTPVIDSPKHLDNSTEPFPEIPENIGEGEDERGEKNTGNDEEVEADDSFEMVEDPNAELDEFEDKNRKVMRSLHRGDQVKHVANISRILGLEAVEGLLILGKDYIYILDNFFQRADGEIVNVWQAPQDERDPYVRMISGRDVTERKHVSRNDEHGTRSWKWVDIISVSKRRFLFRDVAIEMFFSDGRSYLLTVVSPEARNELHGLISAKAPSPNVLSSTQPETAWRYETLKSVEDEPQTFGSKFANVFGQQSNSFAATRKWQKGEMSNFHYLMLINTMAGRTYNDLTQYPVFPWVIADYTSDELDLTDPRSFRDLSKPMGCQTPEREREFRERYYTFAEMGDNNTPAFHYGTHYSSAMIVTSYLIRLQPFVKSYLLLQGGTFDHPDRMFFSIEGAWKSASRMNMTDVRELTPEFYYLPEFLVNVNDYDFGTRQNSSKSIGNVELPPWAKGDPRIFIAKQREALESPHVSRNLHKWIDLIFGSKQKGEAAVEAVNVFHYLSYQGAKDVDKITDPLERLATIGIIHNFGQTPYQVFTKPHPAREQVRHRYKRLDTAAESLTRVPSTLLETGERVASLSYSWKADKLLCSGAFRLNIPPGYEMYMEWGFSDNSVRFYSTDSRKQLGLFEHLHIGQLSCALFTDSKTLVTAGTDCTIAVWSVVENGKAVDLQPRATLFGHRKPVTVLALSRSFNALLSASSDGQVMLWDLNRCEFVRTLDDELSVNCAAINDVTGNIVLCHGHEISLYTLNGDRLLRQESGDRLQESIISCACYEGASSEWLERDLVFTGHKRGQVRIWNKVVREGRFELDLIRQLNHADISRDDGANVGAGISCILAMPQVVYTGDEDGRVYEWNCVQRH